MQYVQNPIRYITDSWLPALFCAATITASLFLLMNYLIQTPKIEVKEVPPWKVPDPVLVEPEIPTQDIPPPPKKVEVVEPPMLTLPVDINKIDTGGGFQLTGVKAPFEGGEKVVFVPTGAPIARAMIAPEYPHGARQNGTEGYVVVRFDVTETGATENIEIQEAEPQGVFDKAAMRAVARWKFTPFEVNGEVKPFLGMSKRLKFELDK